MLEERSARRLLIASGIVGVAVAALMRFVDGPAGDPLSRLLALGVAGVAPLVLATLPRPADAAPSRLLGLAALAHPPAAAAAVASLFLAPGAAGPWVSGWMAFAVLAACLGIARLAERAARRDPAQLVASAALLSLPVAAGFLVAARMGARPFDLDPLRVTLVAVHLLFATFASTALAARVASALPDRPHLRLIARASALLVVAAQPLLLLGLSPSPFVGLVGAALLTSCWLGLATITLASIVPRIEGWLPRLLLVVSALSVLISLPLAVVHAGAHAAGEDLIGLEWMIRVHGFAQAHGFAVCGLLAWAVIDRRRGREPGAGADADADADSDAGSDSGADAAGSEIVSRLATEAE